MKLCRIKSAEAVRCPVLRITFDDGLSGEYDLSDVIAGGPMFAALKNEAYFQTVAVGPYGRPFEWNLDDEGHEIEFCPDATLIQIETRIVEELAFRHPGRQTAAE